MHPFMTDYPSRLPRVPFDRPIRVADGTRVIRFRANNLSLGGMFIESDRPPTVGARVSVALDTGSPSLHLGEAEVVWRASSSNPGTRKVPARFGFGLRFVDLKPAARSLVEAMVRHGGTSSMPSATLDPEEPTKPDGILEPEPKTDPVLH